jgi:uncharacterized membrane protein
MRDIQTAPSRQLASGQEPSDVTPQSLRGALLARAGAAVAATVCFLFLPASLGWVIRVVSAWDLAVLILIGEGWFAIARSNPAQTRRYAAIEDPGRIALLAISLGASAISLIAALLMVTQDQVELTRAPNWLRLLLSAVAIVGAWALLHTSYTLHYARLYYADPSTIDSLAFFGGPPDGWDFAYFAFGVGMTFQVPDVNVLNRAMRRVVLRHQIASFAYNTAILALVINLLAGRL